MYVEIRRRIRKWRVSSGKDWRKLRKLILPATNSIIKLDQQAIGCFLRPNKVGQTLLHSRDGIFIIPEANRYLHDGSNAE